jgi:phosphate transport system permease protein
MRKFINHSLPLVTGAFAALSGGVLLLIVAAILFRGLPAMSWRFLTEQIRLVGAEGGIFFNLVGTLILLGAALATSAPLALGLALTHSVYLTGRARTRRGLGLFLNVLNGVPSIVFGLFGLVVFVGYFHLGKSWLTGGVLLGIMILPTLTVALIERIEALPGRYIEAAAGLGLTQTQIIRSVILPQSFGGLVTGSLLGLARAAGETAPIMFTATVFAGATFPKGIHESPVLSLPYHIFILAQDSFDPGVREKIWGTAIVLLGIVFVLSLIALPMRLKIHDEARHV